SPNAVPGTLVGFLFPLTFGSNVFVDPSTMPGWLQGWVHVNPVSHLTSAARGLLLGDGPWVGHAAWAFVWAIGIAAVFMPLALRAYRRRVGGPGGIGVARHGSRGGPLSILSTPRISSSASTRPSAAPAWYAAR